MQAFLLVGIKPPSSLNHLSPREKVCSFHGRPYISVSIARTRPRSVTFTPPRCCTTPADPASEEEVLDEAAMRAAEIHEVLTGLEEFKMRIVDGAYCYSPERPVQEWNNRLRWQFCVYDWTMNEISPEIDATKLAKKVRGSFRNHEL